MDFGLKYLIYLVIFGVTTHLLYFFASKDWVVCYFVGFVFGMVTYSFLYGTENKEKSEERR